MKLRIHAKHFETAWAEVEKGIVPKPWLVK